MDIDLNLSNYTLNDLERFFGLSNTYTIFDIEQKNQSLLDRLLQINVNPNVQKDIIRFLQQAKDKLLMESNIIPKQVTPFVYSNPSDYFKGTFNPIEKRLTSKILCIDTLFRSNYKNTKPTDYTYTFPESINNVVSLQIKSFEIPYAWFNISAAQKNNSFIIKLGFIDGVPTGIDEGIYTCIIPDGTYTIENLILVLNSILPSGINASIVGEQLTILSDDVENGDTVFSINFESDSIISLGNILGFQNTIYSGFTSYQGETFVGAGVMNNYLFIDVDDFHNNHTTDAILSVVQNNTSPSYLGNNIMGRIPILDINDVNSLITNNNINSILKKRDYFGPVKLEKMNIRILNKFGEVIDLNKNNYSIVFEITQLYS
jgi:hypothetical protein